MFSDIKFRWTQKQSYQMLSIFMFFCLQLFIISLILWLVLNLCNIKPHDIKLYIHVFTWNEDPPEVVMSTVWKCHWLPAVPVRDQAGVPRLFPIFVYTLRVLTSGPYIWYQNLKHWALNLGATWGLTNLAVSFGRRGDDVSIKA